MGYIETFRQHTVAKRLNYKLSKCYYGPFQIIEKIGAIAYRLHLPSNSRIHCFSCFIAQGLQRHHSHRDTYSAQPTSHV